MIAPGVRTGTLDSVDVQHIDGELIAVRDGATTTRLRLEPREKVRWTASRGTVGAALTNKRLLGVSLRSSGWRTLRLTDGERLVLDASLGGNLLVAATQRRILAFHGTTGVWSEVRFSPGEGVEESAAGDQVAVVLTNQRAVGFAASRSDSRSLRFDVHESRAVLRVLSTVATVLTERRLLTYDATLGLWRQEDRPPS